MAVKYRLEVLRNTFIGGELKRPGDIVEVGEIDRNTLLHFAKAKEATIVGDAPKADQREKELVEKMSKRSQPKPRKKEIVNDGAG